MNNAKPGRPRRNEMYGATTITISEAAEIAIGKIIGLGPDVGLPRVKSVSGACDMAVKEIAAQIEVSRNNPGTIKFMTRPTM